MSLGEQIAKDTAIELGKWIIIVSLMAVVVGGTVTAVVWNVWFSETKTCEERK